MRNTRKIRVLIVDDDEDDYLLTSENLRDIPGSQFEIEWAPSYAAGLARVKACEHDVFIIDYYLGANTGLTLIKEALKAQCEEPMILLTGVDDPVVDEEAAELGVFDYLLKGSLSAERLERSIRYALAQASMLKAVRENEAKFRTVFEKSHDMIFITDESGKLMSVSNSAAGLTGFTIEELLQKTSRDLYANPMEGETIEAALAKDGEVSGSKIELLTKNGERRICTIYATMQSDRYGRRYCQGVLHDLTAKIREERATVLSEKMEATGRLMRMLAHEVRNPLTNIGLALEGFAGEIPADSDLHDFVDIIKRNSKRIDNLITQLLNSAKPAELHPKPVSAKTVIIQTLDDVRDRMALKHIALEENYDETDDTVMLDIEKIKIAFTNIIINAVEAMKEGEGILTITTQKAHEKIVIVISDNGVGIPQDHITQLFEPYFTSKSGGMGLGLASTLNIIQSHGGTIDVESGVGVGTSFYVTFNLAT